MDYDYLDGDTLFEWVDDRAYAEDVTPTQIAEDIAENFLPKFEAAIYKNLAEKNKNAQ